MTTLRFLLGMAGLLALIVAWCMTLVIFGAVTL